MALTRKFNGKVYHFHAQFMARRGGERRADTLTSKIREAGGLARTTTEGKGLNKVYIVWSRNR